MKSFAKLFRPLAGVALFSLFLCHNGLQASSTYSTSVTSATSLTIYAATSGMTSRDYGVYLVDSNNVKRPTSEFSYTINGSTYDVSIAFDPAFTGTVKLKGLFTGADTAHDYDFKLTVPGIENGQIKVCDGCVDTGAGYAKRSYASKHYVSTTSASAIVDLSYPGSCNGNGVFAYVLDNQLYFGSTHPSCLSSVVNAKVATLTIAAYPANSVHLGYVSTYYGSLTGLTDDRPF